MDLFGRPAYSAACSGEAPQAIINRKQTIIAQRRHLTDEVLTVHIRAVHTETRGAGRQRVQPLPAEARHSRGGLSGAFRVSAVVQ
jgi:hypothetical protein